MWQQGQVFKLKTRGREGQPLWAYRYRLEGRGSVRPQVGGFATRGEAVAALEKVLARRGPAGRAAAMTLGELVDEYLEMHQAEPVTMAKLRWLLGKATATLGEVRLADLSPKDVYAWRLTIPEGHRFEATQALRQVLGRAVVWGLLESNPAKRVSRTSCAGRRRSSRSSRGSRSTRSPSGSVSSTGRWSCSQQRRGFDRGSSLRLSSAMSTVSSGWCMCGGRTRTGGSSTRRRG